MSDATPDGSSSAATERRARLENLVSDWFTVPELAEIQGIKVNDVRRQLKDGDLIGVRRGPNNAVYVPARFTSGGDPLPRLKGTFTVLKDGGMNDDEVVEWLFTPDASLPGGGSPMDAVEAGHITEIRRRAMESAL